MSLCTKWPCRRHSLLRTVLKMCPTNTGRQISRTHDRQWWNKYSTSLSKKHRRSATECNLSDGTFHLGCLHKIFLSKQPVPLPIACDGINSYVCTGSVCVCHALYAGCPAMLSGPMAAERHLVNSYVCCHTVSKPYGCSVAKSYDCSVSKPYGCSVAKSYDCSVSKPYGITYA